MSRNLCQTECGQCGIDAVRLVEDPRLLTEEDAGVYHASYRYLVVANAECALCGAKYLAWVSGTPGLSHNLLDFEGTAPESRFRDLSYRSTFNDEAGPDDMPVRDGRALMLAAPDLYAALEAYRDAVAALTSDAVTKLQSAGLSLEIETARMMDSARRLAVAALAKAQGE